MTAFLLNKAAATISGSTCPVTTFGQTIPRGSFVLACAGAGAAGAVTLTGFSDNSSQSGDANVYISKGGNGDGTNLWYAYGSVTTRDILSTDTITAQFSGSLTRMAAHVVVFTRCLGTIDTSGTVVLFASPINYFCPVTARSELIFCSSVIATGTPTTSGYADSTLTPLVGVNTAQASVNVEVSCSWGILNVPTTAAVVTAPTVTNMVSCAGALLAFKTTYPAIDPSFPSRGKSVRYA